MDFISVDMNNLKNQERTARKEPRLHQREAFQNLSKTFDLPIRDYKAGLLVLPTGAGKTFTAVNWICRNILSSHYKVLWLAQSSYLLDQAFESFSENISNTMNREIINIRVISSNPMHSRIHKILDTDDVLIMTDKTAINNLNNPPLDQRGNPVETRFETYLKNLTSQGLFIVVDEAHHVPAYGMRTLLMSLKSKIPNLYILGLTATPMHGDKKISGWLYKIFNKEIIYQADKKDLILNNILAAPVYIEKETGKSFELDDRQYNRIVRDNKDLPEEIVDKLAHDNLRNSYIVNEYIANKDLYGKTLIFADRWYQCEFMKDKLNIVPGIRAEAVYSNTIIGNDGEKIRGNRTNEYNNQIIRDFKNDKYNVLLNVRMMTEGIDVPDIKSIFITRQTTSPILMTQMIGRGLRGKKAGGGEGKDQANIVFFTDNWKRLINFTNPKFGGVDDTQVKVQGYYPYEYISMKLMKRLFDSIDKADTPMYPSIEYLPVGWYEVEYTVSDEEEEELKNFVEYFLVYEHLKHKYRSFIEGVKSKVVPSLADEEIKDEEIRKWIDDNKLFNYSDEELVDDMEKSIVKITRHIAQTETEPQFYPFEIRDQLDLSIMVDRLKNTNILEKMKMLQNEYYKAGSLWKSFYKDFYSFKSAYDDEEYLIYVIESKSNNGYSPSINKEYEISRETVLIRDDYRCVCCGKGIGRGVRLEIDHILPFDLGGPNTLENLQTLCKECNIRKGRNIIDFRNVYATMLKEKPDLILIPSHSKENPIFTLIRTINFFYRCNAVTNIVYHVRSSGRYYDNWVVELYHGNDSKWLEENKKKILEYIQNELENDQVKKIQFVNI